MPARYRTMSEREQLDPFRALPERVTLIDADVQGSALDASERRLKEGRTRLLRVAGVAVGTLHREPPDRARDADHVAIDGPPRVAGQMRSALLAADLVPIPARPLPFDGRAADEIMGLVAEAQIFSLQTVNRLLPNRSAARTVIARGTAKTLADHEPSPPMARIGRGAFAGAAQSGRLVSALDDNTADRGSDGELTARLTIDVTPALRDGITVAAFRRRLSVAEMLRALRAGDFSDDSGTAP
jgi:chromosome partitioning protein